MKITLVCDVFGEENNGTTITARRLIDGLQARGHEVRMLSTFSDPNGDPMFYTVPCKNFGILNEYVEKNGVKLAKIDEDVIRAALDGVDVAHVMMPFALSRACLPILQELDLPFTTAFHVQPENVTVHVGLQNFELANKMVYDFFRSTLYKHTNYIHCPTEFIGEQCEKHGYKAQKFIISNGVAKNFKKDKTIKKPAEYQDKFCILFSGRYSKEKRHDLLIKAALKSKYKDKIQLIFAGRGPCENSLRRKGRRLPNPISFVFLDKDQLNETINFCDLYVHPSDVEIEAISCLEAITCGLVPVISNSKKSATRYFAIHDTNSFKAGKANDLAQKIDFWIEHPQEKELVSKQYIEYSKQFDIDNCIDEMVKMFEQAINDKKQQKTQKV